MFNSEALVEDGSLQKHLERIYTKRKAPSLVIIVFPFTLHVAY